MTTAMTPQIAQQAKEVCPTCGAKDIIKSGKRKDKQVYLCKPCGKYFTDNGALPGKRIPPQQVALALGMFFSGSSYRDIQDTFDEQFNYKPSTATLYEWVIEYTGKAGKILDRKKANTGDTWVADETVIRIDGGKVWLWNVVDEKTRMLLATHLSRTRTIKDAEILFGKAKRRAAHTPKTITTDKLAAYDEGIERVFGGSTKHIKAEGIRSKELNNNISERMQGTIKERTKVMRGLGTIETAQKFFNGFALHYNHVKDHDTLGKAPAEVARMPLVFETWLEVASLKDSDVTKAQTETLQAKPAIKGSAFKGRLLGLGSGTFRSRRRL